MTYDHLLAQGERLVEMLGPKADSAPDFDPLPGDFNPFDEDIPF
jgi:hypothetical protein